MSDPENPKLKGTESGAVIDINSNPFSIGRGLACNFVVVSKTMSRVHCVLAKNGDSWFLRDTSTNGTYLNNTLLNRTMSPPLKDGDCITFEFGKESYTFETVPKNNPEDISDEQLCLFADSVLNEMEMFQRDAQNRGNSNDDVVHVEGAEPTTTNTALQDHLGMAKTIDTQPPNKKQKIEIAAAEAQASSEEGSSASTVIYELETGSAAPARSSGLGVVSVGVSSGQPETSTNTINEPANVTSTIDIKASLNPGQPAQAAVDQQDKYEVMEDELQCSICSELFVKAVTLTCSHTYCKYCIEMWKKNKSICPICRTKITGMTSTIVLDNVIEKVIEGASGEVQERRKQMLEERRKIQEDSKPPQEAAQGTGRERRGRSSRRINNPRNNNPVPGNSAAVATTDRGAPNANVIEVSSDSDTDSESSDTDDDMDNWQEEYDNDHWYDDLSEYNEGLPGAYYGGYGHCYVCGSSGHWANGCPFR